MLKTIYSYSDVLGECVQGLKVIIGSLLPENTYIGSKYEQKVGRDHHVILNIQAGSEFYGGSMREYTVSGMIVSNSRISSLEINELVIAGIKVLPVKWTILKNIEISSSGQQIESNDGQEYMRGFNCIFLIKANQKNEFILN